MWGGRAGRCRSRPRAPAASAPLLAFPLTHLWFLYVLTLIYAAALPLRGLLRRSNAGTGAGEHDAGMRAVVAWSRAALVLSAPLMALSCVAVAALCRHPDARPVAHPEPAGGGGVLVGLLSRLADAPAGRAAEGHRTAVGAASGAAAMALTVACLGSSARGSASRARRRRRTASTPLLYAAGVMGWTLGLIGIACFAGRVPVRRYVSDASFWILPGAPAGVDGAAGGDEDWPLHWAMKFPLVDRRARLPVCDLSPAGALHVHRRGAERNVIRRRRPSGARPLATAAGTDAAALLALLTDVRKRFGAVKALDGLEPRRQAGRAARGARAERRRQEHRDLAAARPAAPRTPAPPRFSAARPATSRPATAWA